MPGSVPATSQLDWLSSTTAMIVLFWSRATRDLLKSFGWGIAALHRLMQRRSCHVPAARPIASIGPAEKETAVERGPAADHRRLARRPVLNDPIQLIGPASLVGNSRETFRKSGTDGSNPVPSTAESATNCSGPAASLGFPDVHRTHLGKPYPGSTRQGGLFRCQRGPKPPKGRSRLNLSDASAGPNSARLGLALPVIERAASGPKHANAAEADRACRIGDASADFPGIGILDNLRPAHR